MNVEPRKYVLPNAFVPWVVLGFLAIYSLLLLVPRVQASTGAWYAVTGTLGGFGIAFAVLFARARARKQPLRIELMLRRPHLVQMILHSSVFVYWGMHWDQVLSQVPLILGQVAFAYLFDLALCFARYGNFRLGLAQVPIVGSTNLFLWFRDPLYGAQLGMIAISILAREYLKWNRGGQRVHIFNPSAIGLFVAAFAMLVTGTTHLSWGPEISVTLGYGKFAYEQIFLAGIIAQLFFGVTWVTASAALTVVGLTTLYGVITGGVFFVDTTIPIAVFLGMTLLVTDPVSSPHSLGGKVLFGALYGAAVMALYLPLRGFEHPATAVAPVLTIAFFDKLLQVPLLNLSVHWLDRIGRWMNLERLNFGLTGFRQRAMHVGVWSVAFFGIRGSLNDHPGRQPSFWRAACEAKIAGQADAPDACDNYVRVLLGVCEKGSAEACHNLGVVFEFGETGAPPDLFSAAGAYDMGCKSGAAESCSHLGGLMLTHGERASNGPRARALFDQACQGGSADGCARLALVAAQGIGGDRDESLARTARAKGCALGDLAACDGPR